MSTSHHVTHVLRKKVGDILTGFDGKGNVYSLSIVEIHKRSVHIEAQEKLQTLQTDRQTTLILSAYKPQRLEFALEKCTELGVRRFIITETEYSSTSLEHLHRKSPRLESIIQQACLQSEQPWFPQLEFLGFENVLQNVWDNPYIGVTKETDTTHTIQKSLCKTFFIGPEGGFSSSDLELITGAGFIPIHPFDHVLRSETAAIAFASLSEQSL